MTDLPRVQATQAYECPVHDVPTAARAVVTAAFYMPYMSVDGIIAGFAAYNRAILSAAARGGALLIGGEDS